MGLGLATVVAESCTAVVLTFERVALGRLYKQAVEAQIQCYSGWLVRCPEREIGAVVWGVGVFQLYEYE